jgi:serine protease Do
MSKTRKLIKLTYFALIITLLSSIMAVFLNGYFFPRLATKPPFSRWGIISPNKENVTVINRTEQVIAEPDVLFEKVAAPAAKSIVNVISFPAGNQAVTEQNIILPRNGTGVILTGDGLVVAHRRSIDEKAANFSVIMFDGNLLPAKLLAIDEYNNLAILKIDKSNLPAIPISSGEICQSGSKIVVVKNDGSRYANGYSERIISSFGLDLNLSEKTVASSEKMEGACLFSPANRDNFYGAALNYKGELVGITAGMELDGKLTSYLIGTDELKNTIARITDGKSKRPVLGLYYLSVNPSLAAANNLSRSAGALVYSASGKQGLAVLGGSPADVADLRLGDIIIAVDGVEINAESPLSELISNFDPGQELRIKLVRSGEELELAAVLQ